MKATGATAYRSSLSILLPIEVLFPDCWVVTKPDCPVDQCLTPCGLRKVVPSWSRPARGTRHVVTVLEPHAHCIDRRWIVQGRGFLKPRVAAQYVGRDRPKEELP